MSEYNKTLPEIIFEGLKKYGDGLFASTKRGGEWQPTNVETFIEKTKNLAMGLYTLGVRPGSKVAIHSENSTEWLMCDLATLSIGAANVPIYTTQPGDQIKYILENSDSVVHIVSNDEMFADTKPLIKCVKNVKAIVSIQGSSHKKLKSFDEVIESGKKLREEKPDLFDELKNAIKPDDLATLIYTSGTTGLPKGVMLTHRNIASNVVASLEKLPFDASEFLGQRVLSYLPLSHVFERMIEYMYISMGCRIYYIEVVEEIRDDFGYVRPFFFATVPRLLEKIHTGVKVKGQELSGAQKNIYYWAIYRTENYDPENPPSKLNVNHRLANRLVYSKIRELFGGNLRGMVSGGAALSPDIFKFMNAIGFICVQGYGLTETSPVITVQAPGAMRIGSSGKTIRDVEVKIAEDGEILSRGPHIMKGYYKDEEQTKEVMTDDGWFKTGDIGKIDDDGFLYITDRKKSMFKLSTGKYVAPQNVENHISGSGFIEQAVVIGYQRKFCSALIVPAYDNVLKRLKRDGYEPSKPFAKDEKIRELIQGEVDKANKNVSPWETVKKFVLLEEPLTIDSGELTPTMKVKRPVVLEKYKEEIESMYGDE
ncbi:MAG: long-chain fatty acid--CoA ligase [Balneolaceae bacterium]|nr:MAG: long-chain fatty acid--CoA ligase [Balneolaceae bacterium]